MNFLYFQIPRHNFITQTSLWLGYQHNYLLYLMEHSVSGDIPYQSLPAQDLFHLILQQASRSSVPEGIDIKASQEFSWPNAHLIASDEKSILKGDQGRIFGSDESEQPSQNLLPGIHPNSQEGSSTSTQKQVLEKECLGPHKKVQSSNKVKNSNSIKKLGRILMDHPQEFARARNIGLEAMKNQLHLRCGGNCREESKRDKFNTHHLRALVNTRDPQLDSFNLRAFRRTLSRWLRSNVMASYQINAASKQVYLNTMKCWVLRGCNKELVTRLEMPQL